MSKNVWEIKKRLSYIKIGVFFLVGLMLLFIALVSIKDFSLFSSGYKIKVVFDFAEGMKRASPVRFCGVDVGEVQEVVVRNGKNGPHIQAKVNIQRGIKIPQGSYFFINSLSLFGEKYLEITPPEEFSEYVKEGETVEGVSPVPLFKLFSSFSKTMSELRAFIKEGEIKESLENTVRNLEDITLEAKGLIKDVRNKRGTIGRLFYDDSLYQETEEFILDIKKNPWKLLHKPKDRK
ncbi:MAG: MlaD family protein [Candidatus Omnitrophica bacterium]|nr:MlaD family protein [Candidatus Omnitrophota bacterium]MCF7887934.1 MlaD family protein [Candidatus Omnitrophota bacterium]